MFLQFNSRPNLLDFIHAAKVKISKNFSVKAVVNIFVTEKKKKF